MADFQSQAMGLTGLTIDGSSTTPSRAEFSTFLNDGVADVTSRWLAIRPQDIDDFLRAFNLLLNRGKHLNIYNIGTTEKIKIKDLAFKLSKIFKKKIFLKKTSLAAGGTKIRIPNINKIKKLGFKYKFNLNKGLKKTIELQL